MKIASDVKKVSDQTKKKKKSLFNRTPKGKDEKSVSEKKKKSLIQTSDSRGMTGEMVRYLNLQLRKGLDFDDALDKVREKFGHSGDL